MHPNVNFWAWFQQPLPVLQSSLQFCPAKLETVGKYAYVNSKLGTSNTEEARGEHSQVDNYKTVEGVR